MNRRPALLLAASATAAALAVAALVVAGRESHATSGATSDAFRGSSPPGRIEMPDFALRDQDGKLVTARGLRDRVVVLTFLDTDCRESCPVIAGVIGAAVPRLTRSERTRVTALAVTVNPDADTAARVRAFLRERRAAGALDVLLGTVQELEPVWRSFKVLSAHDSGSADIHSAPVRVYDRSGAWVSTLHAGADLSAANLLHDVRRALD